MYTRQFLLAVLLFIFVPDVQAQTYYSVTHTSGTQTINGVAVTVTPVASPGSAYNCTGPYYIGASQVNGYIFSFNPPVGNIRINNSIMHPTEIVRFYINGSHYTINSGNIAASGVTCSGASATAIANTNGDLTATGSGYANMQVNLSPGYGIDSIRVLHLNGQGGGCLHDFSFANDTSVNIIPPFNDTLLCVGDTLNIDYAVTRKFQSSNTFTAQLSDASGSFASPTTLGTINSDTNGSFSWIVPGTITPGAGYRVRVIASNPVRNSANNGTDILIGNTPVSKPVAGNNGPVCNNDTLKLTASTSTSGVTYKWTGPGGFNSSLQNPTIPSPVPANGGSYIVTAQLYGCLAKDTTTATVNAGSGPTGVTATSNAPLCADDTLKLFGTANGTGNTYSWTGPNSFTSNQQNPVLPSATAALAGDYVLYAGNGNCVSRDTVTIVVKPRPANFTASYNGPVCTGETLNFTASSGSSGVTWSWTGPNSFSSTTATPFINGASAVHNGDYIITATLNGCSLKDTITVAVKPLPNKPVAGSNSPICAGDTLHLTSTSTTGSVTYSWTGPGSYTSSTQNPSVTNTTTAMSGMYISTVTFNGCIRKDTATVVVKPMPVAVTATNNGPVCAGDTLKLYATASSTGATYQWVGPGSFSAGTQNAAVSNSTVAATGWYEMTVDLNGCYDKDSTYATVNAIPATPNISFNSPLCIGETLSLNASTISGGTYSWTGPGNYTSAIQNPVRANMQFGDTGSYTVAVTVNGCTSPAGSTKVNLNPTPFVVILANPADSICQGDPVVFTALPNNHGGVPQYRWFVNAQSVGTGTVFNTGTLNDGDVINCEMTENTKCSVPYKDASNDVTMTVLPWLAPSVTITANPTHPLDEYEYVTFTAVTTNAGKNPSYQWKRNGQDIVGAKGSTWSANSLNDNDSVSVEITSDYKCPQPTTALSNWIRVRLTDVDDINSLSGFVLYPNPNKGRFVLEASLYRSPEGVVPVTVEVMNSVGQIVHKGEFVVTGNSLKHTINMEDAPTGIYLLRLHTDEGVAVKRFSVEQ